MGTTGKLETEQKYDAETSSALPDLLEIEGVDDVAEPVTDHLEAVYFDTPSLALAARRLTLRRRTGGADAGWHLKLPAGTDQREEIHAPLGQPETVPDELSDSSAGIHPGRRTGARRPAEYAAHHLPALRASR